jgi:ABC-2 type transport system ATP-binding protein
MGAPPVPNPESAMHAIETTDISKSYGPIRALEEVSFTVGKGEVIGLLGPNGAGKTTLMKILTGYLQPSAGEARVAGFDVVAEPLEVQRRIGYLPESAPLYREMTVQEYLMMIAELRSVPPARRRRYLSEAIYATGLEEHLRRSIGALSKGFRQRVGIAQAILHKPELLILDEPTTGLDPSQIVEIRELIRQLSEHSTVILSTHILSEVEQSCERVIMIARGRLRADAGIDELRGAEAERAGAIVIIEREAVGVESVLAKIDGVAAVERAEGDANGWVSWRVSADAADGDDLCPRLFEALRHQSWRVAELRGDRRSLEAVFRELAATDETSGKGDDAAAEVTR